MINQYFEVPIVLFVFRRLDTVKLIWNEIEKVKPSKLYVFSDGSREGKEEEKEKVSKVREFLKDAITWKCDAHFEFAEKNKGCASNICEGIDYVFRQEKQAIILEDDAVPLQEFFWYCRYLLEIKQACCMDMS